MPKLAPSQNPSPAFEKCPSQGGWLLRQRGKMAFLLSMAIGCNADPVPPSETASLALGSLEKMAGPIGVHNLEDEMALMPHPLGLVKGTFLENNRAFIKYWQTAPDRPGHPVKKMAGCKTFGEWAEETEINGLKMSAVRQVEGVRLFEENPSTYTEPFIFDTTDNLKSLDSLPASYRTLLKEFDPVLYASLKDRISVKVNESLKEDLGARAYATGPYNLIGKQLVMSPRGRLHAITVPDMPDINLEEALQKNDRTKVVRSIVDTTTLGHEIFGHNTLSDRQFWYANLKTFSNWDEQCSRDLPGFIQGEIYSYYVTAKMTAFIANRYPEVRNILNEAHAIGSRSDTEFVCDPRGPENDPLEGEVRGWIVGQQELLKSYEEAEATGDWKPFKDLLFVHILSFQFGLPYLLPYLKAHGKPECAAVLDRSLKRIMDSESPEKIIGR